MSLDPAEASQLTDGGVRMMHTSFEGRGLVSGLLHGFTMLSRSQTIGAGGAGFAVGLFAVSGLATAHEIDIPVNELRRGVERLEKTLDHYAARPVFDASPSADRDPRLVLGSAEIDFALGDRSTGLCARCWLRSRIPPFSARGTTCRRCSSRPRSSSDGATTSGRWPTRAGRSRRGATRATWPRPAPGGFSSPAAGSGRPPEPRSSRCGRLGADAPPPTRREAAAAAYEAAFAARARGDADVAQRLLATVPSGSPHGSRAAYLAGVIFVERGDLANAERWFSAVMDWPLPSSVGGDADRAREIEVRAVAAMSAARLRYEQGELEGALEAYARVPESTPQFADACWEQAFLTLELERPRAALDHLRCVTDLGAAGRRYVDARLFQASLWAHLEHHDESIELYQQLERRFTREAELFRRFRANVTRPAEFLFEAMERSAADEDEVLSPGAPTLFADAWTPDVDAAYRLEAGLDHAESEAAALATTVEDYRERLESIDAFPEVRFRRDNLERLLVEIDHLIGHGGQIGRSTVASRALVDAGGHPEERERVGELIARLRRARSFAQAQLTQLLERGQAELAAARRELAGLRGELSAIDAEASALRAQARPVSDEVAAEALDDIDAFLAEARMRAEVGLLDTYWIRKQQRTRAIESILNEKKETERLLDEALRATRDP
jgi:tetratricopeptide (TPR) repeat protein